MVENLLKFAIWLVMENKFILCLEAIFSKIYRFLKKLISKCPKAPSVEIFLNLSIAKSFKKRYLLTFLK
jgi:hypothetical protein